MKFAMNDSASIHAGIVPPPVTKSSKPRARRRVQKPTPSNVPR